MKYARIVDNKVWETFTPPTGVDISECFTPELVAQFVECPDNVEQNWTVENGTFIEPVIIPIEEPTE
jgi:hypothetical protein